MSRLPQLNLWSRRINEPGNEEVLPKLGQRYPRPDLLEGGGAPRHGHAGGIHLAHESGDEALELLATRLAWALATRASSRMVRGRICCVSVQPRCQWPEAPVIVPIGRSSARRGLPDPSSALRDRGPTRTARPASPAETSIPRPDLTVLENTARGWRPVDSKLEGVQRSWRRARSRGHRDRFLLQHAGRALRRARAWSGGSRGRGGQRTTKGRAPSLGRGRFRRRRLGDE